jgi:hypothetical protein
MEIKIINIYKKSLKKVIKISKNLPKKRKKENEKTTRRK